ALLDALTIVVNQYAIDELIEKGQYQNIVPFAIVTAAIGLAFGLIVFGFIYQGGIIEANVNYNLRKQAFNTLQRLPFSYYDKTPQGWIMARMTSDARRLSQIISWGLVDLVWSALSMIITLVILYIYFWPLAIIVTVSLPFMFLIIILFRKRVLIKHRQARHYNSELTAKYNESFHGAKTSKSLVIEDENLFEFDQTANLMKRASIKANSLSALF